MNLWIAILSNINHDQIGIMWMLISQSQHQMDGSSSTLHAFDPRIAPENCFT